MDELENNLQRTRQFLEEIIDIDFGLTDKLRAKGILSIREIEDITANITFIRRNSMLLDIISKKKKIFELCDALKDTGQQHIVNYLNARGERSPQFDEDWPLTQTKISIIESNHEALVDILDTCDLTGRLYSNGVINKRHLEFISSNSASYEKNKALLGILRRCSLRSYAQTIKCLSESNQKHIAELLGTGGALVPVHATLESDNNLDETEELIVDGMANFLIQGNVSLEQANRLLAATQLKIIAFKRGQSIVVFICCSEEEELDRLCKMIDNLEMKKFLEQLFNLITRNTWIRVVSVKILEKNFENAKQFFKRMEELKNITTEGDYAFTSKKDSTYESNFGNEEPMEVTTGKSTEESKEEELTQESEDPGTSVSVEDDIVELENNLHKTREFLEEIIDVNFGLIETLHVKSVLSIREIQDIKARCTSLERNSLLLDKILKNRKIPQLCEALKETGQQHIVNFVKACGEYSPIFVDDWPLSEREISTLEDNRKALVDHLYPCDLTIHLYSKAAINSRHRDFILSKSTYYEKNKALLEILRRCNLRSYVDTIKHLLETNQNHTAEILETGRVLVPVHSKLETDNLDETETQIANEFTNLLMQRNVSANRVLNAAQLNVIAVKRGQ